MAAATAAAIGVASPAYAVVTFADYNGPDLTTAIHASGSNLAQDQVQVYGSTTWPVGEDTIFTGYTTGDVGTAIHITGGSGFASITDTNGTNNSGVLYALMIDPPAFTDLEFSIQLVSAGTITVWALVNGVFAQISPLGGIQQNANQNNQYLVSGNGAIIDEIKIVSTAPIFEVKQNSINLAGAPVPEPASWALMLLGFAGIGMTIRRSKRRSSPKLLQIA